MSKHRFTKLIDPYVIRNGRDFHLKRIDPDETAGFHPDKELAAQALRQGVERLHDLQEKLYAQGRWGVLLVFQAMDAAGKDGAIEHVMSGVNPQGCEVHSFKQPSAEELGHDFLWRCAVRVPERGRIGIFNRSYYEEVLVVRVHPEILEQQRLPESLVTRDIWKARQRDINAFEGHLSRNGYVIRKFFLHISRKEQTRRFEKRLDEPAKNWKFSMGDVKEQQHWREYMAAYEDTIRQTATPHAPWVVVPANKKWFARLIVAATIIDALEGLDLAFPKVTPAKQREIAAGRRLLARSR